MRTGWSRHVSDVVTSPDVITQSFVSESAVAIDDAHYDDDSHTRERRYAEYQPAILEPASDNVS